MGDAATPAEVEEAVRAAARRFVAAIGGGDSAAAAIGYADDALLLAPSAALIEGRTAIEAFWRAGLEAGIRTVELQPLRITTHRALAFEIGRYAMRLRRPNGDCVVDRGSYLLIHERSAEGAWAWRFEAFTPDGPPQVVPAAPPPAGSLS